MPDLTANRLYLFNQYVNIDPALPPPDLNTEFGVSSVSLLAEPAKPPSFDSNPASKVVLSMNDWFRDARDTVQSKYPTGNAGSINPVVLNVEVFGRVYGDAIEDINPALSNVRAAIALIQKLRAEFPVDIRPLGAYITIPRSKFFDAYGYGETVNGYVANFYEKVNAATIELLSQHVDFFVLDGYVPWAGVPQGLLDTWFPKGPNPTEQLLQYLARCQMVASHPHYRFPGRFMPPGQQTFIDVPVANRGITLWDTSDWVLQTIRYLRYQMQLVNQYSRGQPVMVWTSTTYLSNGIIYNDRTVPVQPIPNPVWDLLIDEPTYRRFMRELIALNPWAIVLLEGFSGEKLDFFEKVGEKSTEPASPWPPGLGPRRGGMRWGPVEGDPVKWEHPYLASLIADIKPTSPSP